MRRALIISLIIILLLLAAAPVACLTQTKTVTTTTTPTATVTATPTATVTVTAAPSIVTVTSASTVTSTPNPIQTITTQTINPTPTSTPGTSLNELPSVADVVAKVSPSVVFVHTRWTVTSLFGRRGEESAAGSGVIITSDGFILTNNHVIEDAVTATDGEITVTLVDGRHFEATMWGTDPLTDLAVLKVEATGLPAAAFGDSTKMRPGDWVVAIGNALDLAGSLTVSLGIVSAQNRSILVEGGNYLHNLVQTDAAINPGNSGGPLINLAGEVVGINTAIAQEAVGIGFAISSTYTAGPVSAQLMESRKVVWPWLGIQARTLTPSLASELGLSVTEGALIVGVEGNTPAAQAGLAADDVITAINGEKVTTIEELQLTTRRYKVGDEIEVTFVRDGQTQTVKLRLAEMPRD